MQNNITKNNNIRLLLNGHETFSAVKEALSKAKYCINLEYFSFHDDETGTAIKNILTERANNGVKVRMLIDSAGSWRLGSKFIRDIESSGVEFRKFMPLNIRNICSGIIHRDHRKIITVDGTTGFLGGFNIGDVYLRQWRDTHIKLDGEAVHELDEIFSGMWGSSGIIHDRGKLYGNVPVKIIASGTGRNFRAVADEYIRVISSAEKRIWITTPYFAPDEVFMKALYSASRSGIDVRIIIPSCSNHALVSWASGSYIDSLIANGIRVFIYQDRFIHAKTMIADSYIASVGTANLDALSFGINYEVQAFIYSKCIAGELEGVFIEDLRNCTEETYIHRKNRPISLRLKERIGRLLSPVL